MKNIRVIIRPLSPEVAKVTKNIYTDITKLNVPTASEPILLDTYSDNAASLDISLDDFKKLRMEDKVKKLKEYLPLVMFNQGFNQIYIKISDGIHNLSEEDCSNMFIVLKDAIEEILIEKMEKSEKAKRQKKLTEELSKI